MTAVGPVVNTEEISSLAKRVRTRVGTGAQRQHRRICAVLHASGRSNDSRYSVTIRGLRLQLGTATSMRQILNGVDLKIKRGSLHMLLGPNGCGKSTLLKVLGGLLPGYSGLIDSDGPSGFVFQNPDHQVVMPTVAADVAFGLGRQVVVLQTAFCIQIYVLQDTVMKIPCHTRGTQPRGTQQHVEHIIGRARQQVM